MIHSAVSQLHHGIQNPASDVLRDWQSPINLQSQGLWSVSFLCYNFGRLMSNCLEPCALVWSYLDL